MGLQQLKAGGLFLFACLLVLSCSDQDAVKPKPPSEVDAGSLELARFALKAAALSSYACHDPADLSPNASVIDFRYTKEFLDSVDLNSFVQRFPQYYDHFDSCFYPETTIYGGYFPFFWGPGSNVYISDTMIIYAWADSMKAARPALLRLADSGRTLDSTVVAYITYLGKFSPTISADDFKGTRFTFRIYPMGDLCDSIDGALRATNQGGFLDPAVLPDSGVFQRNWYYNSLRQPLLKQLSVYVAFHNEASVIRIDTLYRDYCYPADTVYTSWIKKRFQVSAHSAVQIRGEVVNDTTFVDTLSNGRVMTGVRHTGGRFTLGRLMSASGDTLLIMTADPLEDTVYMHFSAALFSGDSARMVRQGEGLMLSEEGASLHQEALSTPGYGILHVAFSGRAGSTAGPQYSGEILLNTFTGKGSGTLYSPETGDSYIISVNIFGVSTIEDIRL